MAEVFRNEIPGLEGAKIPPDDSKSERAEKKAGEKEKGESKPNFEKIKEWTGLVEELFRTEGFETRVSFDGGKEWMFLKNKKVAELVEKEYIKLNDKKNIQVGAEIDRFSKMFENASLRGVIKEVFTKEFKVRIDEENESELKKAKVGKKDKDSADTKKRNIPKVAQPYEEDSLTIARHIARSKAGETALRRSLPNAEVTIEEKKAEKTVAEIPVFGESAETSPRATPPTEAPRAAEGTANRLDEPKFAKWFSEIEGVDAGDPVAIERYFKAFELKEPAKERVFSYWRERVKKESALSLSDADLASIGKHIEDLARRDPEKFVELYGDTLKNYNEMPAQITRLEAELAEKKNASLEELQPALPEEEKKLELVRQSNRLFGLGRFTGIMAKITGNKELKKQAEARAEIRKNAKYKSFLGGVKAGGISEALGISKGGAVGERLLQIAKEYADAVGRNDESREQIAIALARAKNKLKNTRETVLSDLDFKREMSESLSTQTAKIVKEILNPGRTMKLEDWIKADAWISGLASRAGDKEKLADYLRDLSFPEVQKKIMEGVGVSVKSLVSEKIAQNLANIGNPGVATSFANALEDALRVLLEKRKIGSLEGDKFFDFVTGIISAERDGLLKEKEKAGEDKKKEIAMKVIFIESAMARLKSRYYSPLPA